MLGLPGIIAFAIFGVAYVLFAIWERHRLLVAGAAAGGVLLLGLLPLDRLAPTGWNGQGGAIEWNTMGLLVGLFLFAGLLHEVGFFDLLARDLAGRTRDRPLRLFFVLTILSFALSGFINSITVLLVLAPLTLRVARVAGLDPVPLIIAEIAASNIGGAATFVGDPPNLILGSFFQLSFSDFLLHTGPPALAALGVLLLLMRRNVVAAPVPGGPPVLEPIVPAPDRPRIGLALVGFGGTLLALSFYGPLGIPIWAIGLLGACVALGIAGRRFARLVLREFDLGTLVFFLFLFVLVGALESTGDIASLAGGIGSIGGRNILLTGTLLLWTLGLLSSVVNNIPLAAASAPLIAALGGSQGLAIRPLVWAASLGSDIGGNGTPIGASSNVVGLGQAARRGVRIGWGQYTRMAFPVMVATLAAANVVWLVIQ
jgi:Na+/H+ antiporter NhaD/arsenite permease-like protein